MKTKHLFSLLLSLSFAFFYNNTQASGEIKITQNHGVDLVNGGMQIYISGVNESNKTYSLTNEIKIKKFNSESIETITCSSGKLSPSQLYKIPCTVIGYQDTYEVDPPVIKYDN